MKFRNRITAVVLVLLLLCLTYYQGVREKDTDTKRKMLQEESTASKESLYVWYTDEAMTDYINSRALDFMQQNEGIRVVPMLVSAVEYLEAINEATMDTEICPDVYILSNDSLEKAYLSGLASEITDPNQLVNEQTYPGTALHAVTYKDMKVAYPFYYETSLFLYNRTYLESMAQTKSEALAAQAQADSGSIEGDTTGEGNADEGVQTTVQTEDLIPNTFDDILSLADEYDAPEGVEAILKWDVSDIFYNYFFAGNYLNVGGENGDDSSFVDICNDQVIACMNVYQSLNQFFSIEAKETNYDSVLQEFIEGKTLFTVATTDAIEKLEQAKADGNFKFEYGIVTLPDVSTELKSRGLSVTNAAVVNGFSSHKELANSFASYLACQTDASLYERTGKIAANKQIQYKNNKIALATQAYEKSASLPKIMQASNFWVQLEVTFTGIWQGKDTSEALQHLEDQIKQQLN